MSRPNAQKKTTRKTSVKTRVKTEAANVRKTRSVELFADDKKAEMEAAPIMQKPVVQGMDL